MQHIALHTLVVGLEREVESVRGDLIYIPVDVRQPKFHVDFLVRIGGSVGLGVGQLETAHIVGIALPLHGVGVVHIVDDIMEHIALQRLAAGASECRTDGFRRAGLMELLHVSADDGSAIIRQVVDCGEVISDVVSRHEEDTQRGGSAVRHPLLYVHAVGVVVGPCRHIRTHSMDGGVDLPRLRIDADDVLRIAFQRIQVGAAIRNGVIGQGPHLGGIAEISTCNGFQQFALTGEELDAIIDQRYIEASVTVVCIRRIGDGSGIGARRQRDGLLHLAQGRVEHVDGGIAVTHIHVMAVVCHTHSIGAGDT